MYTALSKTSEVMDSVMICPAKTALKGFRLWMNAAAIPTRRVPTPQPTAATSRVVSVSKRAWTT
jgi:hypothetical protein